MSWGEFKAVANEVGNWCWGTLEGGFNEKQTIGQITTDAVISMFPIAGEVTAARDVIASIIRMADDPKKREEVSEWVILILPLLALVPLFGGAVKGVGKLLMRVGKNAEEDRKIFNAIIALLNKIGQGNAVKFIRELDFLKYAKPIVDGVNEAALRVKSALAYLQARMKPVLPEKVTKRMEAIQDQIDKVRSLAGRMVPKALKELNVRLRVIQQLAYEGEWHLIPNAGKVTTREVEARLVTTARGKIWEADEMHHAPNTLAEYSHVDGWPNLASGRFVKENPRKPNDKDYWAIKAFNGSIKHKELREGTIIYRVLEPADDSMAAGFWWCYLDPKSIKGAYWRVKFAVLQSWSQNGKYVTYVIPPGKTLRAWEGTAASQIDNAAIVKGRPNEGFGQYLEGGETQLLIDFTHDANQYAEVEVKALQKQDTAWNDHMNINIPDRNADVQYLGKYEQERKTLASANLGSAANMMGKATRAASDSEAHNSKP